MSYQVHIETPRLIMREFREEDAEGLFKMESDPLVLKYLEVEPLQKLDDIYPIIERVQKQYEDNGIGRWVMIEKQSGELMGWTGLKLEPMETNGYTNYYDLGYRMIPRYWGKGYATESALASVDYGFKELHLDKINGAADVKNIASNRVLQKTGLQLIEAFDYQGIPHHWYELKKEEWESKS
jgi:RimJ/RimL family protein N-acetyltransferase